jgi:hypothetical protein
VEPWPEGSDSNQRTRRPRENQKGRLKGILGGMRIAQRLATDSEHHRAVALDQRGESKLCLVALRFGEPLEQLGVGASADSTHGEERAELGQKGITPIHRHLAALGKSSLRLSL